MNQTVFKTPKTTNKTTLKTPLIALGLMFIVIGLSITIGIVYLGFNLINQPELLSTIFTSINTEDGLFIKWLINGQSDEIEFSRIIALIIMAIAASIIIYVIIAFITMCINSGKSLLNLSRNFNE